MTSVLLPIQPASRNLNLHMKSKSILGAGALLFTALGAHAGSVSLVLSPSSYNFQLAGGGGGSSALLNGAPVEIFCDNFANEIYVPSNNLANVTVLGTSANLDETRFGSVAPTGWTTITLTDGNSADSADEAFFNDPNGSTPEAGSTALARYEMAAYLVSLYNVSQGSNTANNEIQEAIWTILDPAAQGPVIDPSGVNPDSYLENAVNWYNNMSGNQTALNNFLSQFEIVSDPSMTGLGNGVGVGGFQEQIVMTPEPRGGIWILLVFLAAGFLMVRRNRMISGASTAGL
jgi:hypothetical protein